MAVLPVLVYPDERLKQISAKVTEFDAGLRRFITDLEETLRSFPGCVGLAGTPSIAIALLCLGGFAHQIISGLLNTLTIDVFAEAEVATANGLTGMASWTGGLLFSLLVGALAERVGYGPLFGCLGAFDLLGAAILIALIRPRWRAAAPPVTLP